METTLKVYSKKNRINPIIRAKINWTPEFLSRIEMKFGLNREFTCSQIEELFKHRLSRDATRMKFLRLYRIGKFKRKLKKIEGRIVYVYSFTESAKYYCEYWLGFDHDKDSPLMRNKLKRSIENAN